MDQKIDAGLHIGLDRTSAKRVFGAKGDEAVIVGLHEIVAADPPKVDYGADWLPLDRVLCELAADSKPLSMCFLGGRRLLQHDDPKAVMVRPDMAVHIVNALAGVTHGQFQQQCLAVLDNSADADRLWERVAEMQAFFQQCCERRDAVVFLTI